MSKNILLVIAVAAVLVSQGCEPAATMETPPPAEQKVVMVPSWKEGEPVQKPADPGAAAEAPALAPGSRPDVPQPGDLDYKGGN